MKRGHEYHRTHDEKYQYCGYNHETGEKFEGVFLTRAEAEQKRAEGFAVEQAARFSHGLQYGA